MKHDETQAYAQDIARQRTARKIHPMNTQTFTLKTPTARLPQGRLWSTALGTLLLCAGAVQAAEPQQMADQRPLDLSVPHDAKTLQTWRKKQALERHNSKPYGSGYEARGLGERKNNDADVTLLPSTPAVGNSHTRGAGAGGSSGGGSGGSGGRGR
jgi:uncharacterized membrane protein YgcG